MNPISSSKLAPLTSALWRRRLASQSQRWIATMPSNLCPSPNKNKSAPNQPSNTQYKVTDQTEGHLRDPKNVKGDPQNEAAAVGRDVKRKGSGSPLDTASAGHGEKQTKPKKGTGKGNPEGVGFVEQVGSGSGSAEKFEKK
ncbi:hypothetical protein H1R20_g1025, partial [Candolleomyces eurysporus]